MPKLNDIVLKSIEGKPSVKHPFGYRNGTAISVYQTGLPRGKMCRLNCGGCEQVMIHVKNSFGTHFLRHSESDMEGVKYPTSDCTAT